MEVDWLRLLVVLAEGDAFGHESWFEIGVEQHKAFYYCLLGDCSISEKERAKAREGKVPAVKDLYYGWNQFCLELAIKDALLRWLLRVAPASREIQSHPESQEKGPS